MALVTAPPDTTRRHVLLIGTTSYLPGWPDISAGVRTELDRAKRLFVDELGYDTCDELVNPDSSALKEEVARWRAGVDNGPDDWLILYYTGHGVERAGMLQLITTDIESDSPETAPTAQDLVMVPMGARQPSHILLIVDTCQSGAAQLDVASTAARLREAQGGAARGADFHVITTARARTLLSAAAYFLAATRTAICAAGPELAQAVFVLDFRRARVLAGSASGLSWPRLQAVTARQDGLRSCVRRSICGREIPPATHQKTVSDEAAGEVGSAKERLATTGTIKRRARRFTEPPPVSATIGPVAKIVRGEKEDRSQK